jgi:ribosomal protein S11
MVEIKLQKTLNFGLIKVKFKKSNTYVTLTDIFGSVLIIKHGGMFFEGKKRRTPYVSTLCFKGVLTSLKDLNITFKAFILYITRLKVEGRNRYVSRLFKDSIPEIDNVENGMCAVRKVKKAHNGVRLAKERRI